MIRVLEKGWFWFIKDPQKKNNIKTFWNKIASYKSKMKTSGDIAKKIYTSHANSNYKTCIFKIWIKKTWHFNCKIIV